MKIPVKAFRCNNKREGDLTCQVNDQSINVKNCDLKLIITITKMLKLGNTKKGTLMYKSFENHLTKVIALILVLTICLSSPL